MCCKNAAYERPRLYGKGWFDGYISFPDRSRKVESMLDKQIMYSSLLPLTFISVISLSQSSPRFDIK